MGGFYLRSQWVLPKNLNEAMEEIYFHGEILVAPVENNAGTALLYVRTVETGVGVFLVDLTTLKRNQILLSEAADRLRSGAVKLFGWSPDDRYLALSTIEKGSQQNLQVTICDGATGLSTDTFEAPRSIEMGFWLTTNSLVVLDDSHTLSLFNLEDDHQLGRFGNKGLVKLRQLDRSGGWLTPISNRSIAYVEHGNVWNLDITANRATQLTHLTNAAPESLDYCTVNGKYLFSLGSAAQSRLYQYDPDNSTVTRTTDGIGLKGRWMQNGNGIAYISTNNNRYVLTIESKRQALRTNLFTAPELDKKHGALNQRLFVEGREVVRAFSLNPKRDKIYVVASINYEPLAIWEYDILEQAIRNVVPEKENSLFSQYILPVQVSMTNQSGRKIDYYYLSPARLDPNKKYPVVMDQLSDLGFQPNSQFLANAGIFYVTVNPYGVGRPDSPTDPDDTLAVYKEILKNPNVDPHRIYLFGESAGTVSISTLLTEHPDLWRGAIMLSPVAFARIAPSSLQHLSFFYSFGDEDRHSQIKDRMESAQEACNNLIRTQILYGHAGHVFFNIEELKKRYTAIATFILSGY
jgi:dipeptidyl aminopeptidase/acylaminoacyl peptidase